MRPLRDRPGFYHRPAGIPAARPSVGARPLASAVAVTDWSSGRTRSFDFGPGHVTDEMVYVPKPGATHEADAWLVGPTINLKAGVSELHVLDLLHVEDGPVATWRADVALPAAFHGNWA